MSGLLFGVLAAFGGLDGDRTYIGPVNGVNGISPGPINGIPLPILPPSNGGVPELPLTWTVDPYPSPAPPIVIPGPLRTPEVQRLVDVVEYSRLTGEEKITVIPPLIFTGGGGGDTPRLFT